MATAAATATPAVKFSELEDKFNQNAPTYQGKAQVEVPLKAALPLGEKRLKDITDEVQLKIGSVKGQGRNIRNSIENVEDARSFIEQAAVLHTLYKQALECKAFYVEHLSNLSPQSTGLDRKKVLADLQAVGVQVPQNVLAERDAKHASFSEDQEMLTGWTEKFGKSLEVLIAKMTELKDLIIPIEGEVESVLWDPTVEAREIFGARSVLDGCLDTATTKEQLATACMSAAQALSKVARVIDPDKYQPLEFSLLDFKEGSDSEDSSQD